MRFKALLAASLFLSAAAEATPVYVGSWDLYSGQPWGSMTAPATTAQQVAAELFGGNASDYAISTVGIDPNAINHMAWLDQIYIGVGQFAENYLVDSNNNGYYDVRGDTSARVVDNGCCNQYINFAFRIDNTQTPVPEPLTLGLLSTGLLGLAYGRRKQR